MVILAYSLYSLTWHLSKLSQQSKATSNLHFTSPANGITFFGFYAKDAK